MLDLASLFSISPRLEDLEIAGRCIRNYETSRMYSIPYLRRFKIDITDQNWLTHICCPNMVDFSTWRITPIDITVKFISSHPSINSLRFWHLTHGSHHATHLESGPRTPQLASIPATSLSHYIRLRKRPYNGSIPKAGMDKRPPLNPRSESAGALCELLWRLKVLIGAHVKRDTIEWQKGQLYAMAKRDVGHNPDFPLYVYYTCSWL
jgi:hypothetical protein